jgi:hypothetical protein
MLAYAGTRLALALAVLLPAGDAGAGPKPEAAGGTSDQPFPPAEARRAPGAKDPPEVIALLRERRDVVKEELQQARKYLADPNLRPDVWAALAERLLVAECDAVESPAERVAAYRDFRDNLKLMEVQLGGVPEALRGDSVFPYGKKLWIQGRRLQAEVSLLRAEHARGEASAAGADSPDVRAALLAWRDSVREWAKLWLESRILLIPAFAREIAATTLEADLAAAGSPAEQLAAYRAYRDRLLAVEKDTKAEMERRRYSAFDYLRIKEMRCSADVVLGRLAAAGGTSGTADPPEVRAALDEWVQAIGFEADLVRKRYERRPVPPADALVVEESLLHERLAAATKPEERVAAYKAYLAKLKEAESAAKARANDTPAAKDDAARATIARAAAELTVLRLGLAPGAKEPPAMKTQLVEQRDALRTELEVRAGEWAAGVGDFQLVQESAGSLLLAELATAGTPGERLEAYRTHLERMRKAEADAKALVAAKKGPEAWLLWTRGARLEAEVWLLRARRNLSAPGPSAEPMR